MTLWQAYLDDVIFNFRKLKGMAEKALGQLDEDRAFFEKPAESANSIALIIKHVAGNLSSRWTDFLATDGDKPWRDRDAEFVLGPNDTRAHLIEAWQEGWHILLHTLSTLQEKDALTLVTIRGEAHTVLQAIQRSLVHTSYHVGQILYLAHLMKGTGWQWITIPPGQSQQGMRYLKESSADS